MRVRLIRLTLLALALVPLACNKGDESTGGNASTQASGEEILVGHFASLTGNERNFGVSTENGIRLAEQERNAAGGVKGRTVRVITYDDAGKNQEAQTAVTRLIEQDNVVALLGEVASSRSIAAGQVAQRQGVPMISPSSTNPQVTQIGNMISRVCFIDPFQGYVGASFARNNLKFEKAATLYNRAQPYSTGLNEEFVKAFEGLGGKVLIQQAYADGDNDFSAQLTAIRGQNPDFVYVPGYYTEIVSIAGQARRLGITAPLIGGDGWVSEELKNAGNALDGCFFSDHYSQQDDRPEVQEFLKKFQDAYGKTPDSMAALGYDAARLLFDAMERAPSLSGDDLAAAIAATKDFPGVTGRITLDENRDARKLAVIQRIEGGKFSYHATVEPPK